MRCGKREFLFHTVVKFFWTIGLARRTSFSPYFLGLKKVSFTNGTDFKLQQLWAAENGLPKNATKEEILLAQIESHRAEVFYNLDPINFPSSFVKRLPNCVRRTIAWRAAPSSLIHDFVEYDLVFNNFPSILRSLEQSAVA